MQNHRSGWLSSRLTCRDAISRVSQYLHNSIQLWAEPRLWLHLRLCPDCRAYAAQLRLLRRAVPLIPIPVLPLGQRMRLRQAFLDSRVRSVDGGRL